VDIRPIKATMLELDSVYEEIARDMKIVPVAVPGTKTTATDAKKEEKQNKAASTLESSKKMEETNRLLLQMYGIYEED
jgi:hypothetical protein